MSRTFRGHRKDLNHNVITAFLACYKNVAWVDTHTIGNGFPDGILAFSGFNILVEIKQPNAHLTEPEFKFLSNWLGDFFVISSIDELKETVYHYCIEKNIAYPFN